MQAGRRERHQAAWALLLIVVWLALTAWARPLTLPDEGRYVGVASEMLRAGDWLVPTLDGLPFFHKPPLFYWITASALAGFGANVWAARAAALLGAAAAAFSMLLFARRWAGEGVARATLLVLLTQPFFYIGAQFANLDMLVAGCIGATILLAAHAAQRAWAGEPHRAALAGAYAGAALGVLAKGLIGMLLPALVIALWLVLLGRARLLRLLVWLPGLALFMLIAAPWFVAMQQRFPGFLHYFFVVQHFERYTQASFNNQESAWFYLPVVALLTLPWFVWLYGACRRSYLRDAEHRPVRLLMWLWLLVVLAFFSIPHSKLLGYVLPALPPLAFLIADSARSAAALSSTRSRAWLASGVLAAATCLVGVAILALYPPQSNQALGRALARERQPGEGVVFLEGYYYDVAFYAGVPMRIAVVDNWAEPTIAQRDNWRKELYDAGRFAPAVAREVLVQRTQFAQLLCAAPVTWVIGKPEAPQSYPLLAGARRVAANRGAALWKIDADVPAVATALQCREKPNAGSADK